MAFNQLKVHHPFQSFGFIRYVNMHPYIEGAQFAVTEYVVGKDGYEPGATRFRGRIMGSITMPMVTNGTASLSLFGNLYVDSGTHPVTIELDAEATYRSEFITATFSVSGVSNGGCREPGVRVAGSAVVDLQVGMRNRL